MRETRATTPPATGDDEAQAVLTTLSRAVKQGTVSLEAVPTGHGW